jgi:hypothetical protein
MRNTNADALFRGRGRAPLLGSEVDLGEGSTHTNIDLLRALLLIRANDGFEHLKEFFAGTVQR